MFELVFELSTVVFGFGASQLLSAVFELSTLVFGLDLDHFLFP